MALVAAAERASRPRSAVGMPLQVALGDHTRPGSSAAAVAQPCRRSGTAAHTPDPQMLRDGNFGRRPESPVLQTPRAEPPLWHSVAASRQPTGGRTGIGLCRATPAAAPPLWSGSALDAARAAAVATRARAHQQERVETRRPSACCLRPRLKHRPAPAKAGSLLSGVVAANREGRRAAARAAAVASSVSCLPYHNA